MARLVCKEAFIPISPSDWVHAIGLDCDDALWVWFKHGQHIISGPRRGEPHGPGAWHGIGGVPAVCCLYPGTAGALGRALYAVARGYPFAGEFVRRFLYKIEPYVLVAPPALPCAGCGILTTCCSPPLPATLFATVSGTTCHGTGSIPLTHGTGQVWAGSDPTSGLDLTLECQGSTVLNWHLSVTCNGTTGFATYAVAGTCDPLSLTFFIDLNDGTGHNACCDDEHFTLTVTA